MTHRMLQRGNRVAMFPPLSHLRYNWPLFQQKGGENVALYLVAIHNRDSYDGKGQNLVMSLLENSLTESCQQRCLHV